MSDEQRYRNNWVPLKNIPLTGDFEFTDADFYRLSNFIYETCGIFLNDSKKELVKSRLGKRIRDGGFSSFRDYFRFAIQDQTGQEISHLINSLTTNFTSFFREFNHFEYLKSHFLKEIIRRNEKRTLFFWSAGCSTGEEPYSIAMLILEMGEFRNGWNIKILGTDISTRALKIAQDGIYGSDRIHNIPKAILQKYFLRGENHWNGHFKIKDEVRRMIVFSRLNLKESFSFLDYFDCIFCRNVMIYFDRETQQDLVNRFYNQLNKGGLLIIGHSESLSGINHPFKYIQPSIYRKEK